MPSAYLDFVDRSHLLMLIVDNADDITDATMSEFQRAKNQNIRISVIFCNENLHDLLDVSI